MKKRSNSIFILFLSVMLLIPSVSLAVTIGPAPGSPGIASTWAPGDKVFLGTSATDTSKVWFTGADGIITEVFYPTADTPNTRDLQFMVGDKTETWVDEEKLQSHTITQVNSRALIWDVTSTDIDNKWKITKRTFTDPARNALIQRVTFQALVGNVSDYNVYILHNPAMSNSGGNDAAKTLLYNGKTMLVASDYNKVSSLTISLPWRNGLIGNGFEGVNDGWTDLLGGASPDYHMDWTYDSADNGNVAQMGLVDFGSSTQTSISFDVILGFAATENEATATAYNSLLSDLSLAESNYINEWTTYTNALNTFGGTVDNQYYLSAMILKASQDKTTGAIVAGLGTPWGDTQGDNSAGGYHLAWARDLYKFSSALLIAGDTVTPNKAVDFLFNYQQNSTTGRFPQNSWVDGTPYWDATQMDEQAMPIILAWKLGRTDLWPEIKKTADYIISNGPWTQQERWEENSGYSPSTIAAEIAGLVCAADIAKANGDTASADLYLATADLWQSNVENWTFTTTGSYGNDKYYIRIDDNGNPNDGHSITIGNGGGTWDERSIVDMGFLELVRLGVKSPNDAYILESLSETDSVIKQTISGKGDAWFRYNHDGYGEKADGSNYDGTGIGRLWPFFTAERGIYEISRGNDGIAYLNTLRAFSSSTGTIPEQVWDLNAPAGYTPGTPTKSMQPLNWSMGEYINLLASIYYDDIADIPSIVRDRYVTNAYQPTSGYKVDYDATKLIQNKAVTIYYKGSLANSSNVKLHWGTNGWSNVTDSTMVKRPDGFWETTVAIPGTATKLDFVFWDGVSSWDNNGGNDWHLEVYAAPPAKVVAVPGPTSDLATTIIYKGDLASSATSLTMHWGVNSWTGTSDKPMTKNADGSWSAAITLPAGSYQLDMAFFNQSGQWDNNSGSDYHYAVSK